MNNRAFTSLIYRLTFALRISQISSVLLHTCMSSMYIIYILYIYIQTLNLLCFNLWKSMYSKVLILPVISGVAETQVTYLPDGGVVVMYPTNMSVTIESGGHPVLSNQHRMHFKRKIIGPNKLVHKLEWRFYARRRYSPSCGRKTLQRLGRKMRVGESRPHVSMSDSPDSSSRGEAKALRVC